MSAPNSGRHFDECPQHPENVRPDLIARAKAAMAEVEDGPDKPAQDSEFMRAAVDLIPKLVAALEARPMHPVVDDLASERLDGIRDERDELRCRVDELSAEVAELRRQLPDDDAEVRRVQ